MKKLIPAVLTVALVVVGASVAMAQSGESDSTTTTTVTEDADALPGRLGHRGEALQEVLDDLVADDTITQEQADAIVAALEAKKAEFLAERDAVRAAWDEAWSDDVLTEDEAAELADAAPFRGDLLDPEGPLAQYWEDGQLTRDELAQARESLGFGHRGHHGRFGDFDESDDTLDSGFEGAQPSSDLGA